MLAAFVLATALVGCATTRVYDSVDRDRAPEAGYDGFLAYAAFEDLALQAVFERRLCAALLEAGHACSTLLGEAPATRDQDGASRYAAGRASGAQALVILELADPETASRRIIAGGRPAYEATVVDNASETVIAKFAIEPARADLQPREAANAVAQALVEALSATGLLFER